MPTNHIYIFMYAFVFQLIRTLRQIHLLTESFEQWGRLSDPRCAENFNKMTDLLKDMVRVLTNYNPKIDSFTVFSPTTPAERIQALRRQKSLRAGQVT